MNHIKLFEEFELNETSKVERIEGYFEGDFLELPLVKRITDGRKLGWMDDYVLDNDGDDIWIELKNIEKKYVDEIDKDYKAFAKDFEEWADKHHLTGAQILTSDPDAEGNYDVTFQVELKPNLGGRA